MSAAMVNVGLMRESRFRIRSVTAHAYACDTVVATRRSGDRPRKWRKVRGFRSPLIADDLDQHALAATAVELAIKNLLPGTEVEFARRNCDHAASGRPDEIKEAATRAAQEYLATLDDAAFVAA